MMKTPASLYQRLLSAACVTACLGTIVAEPAHAASNLVPLGTTGNNLSETLVAGRLQLRLGVRSSRYRVGGFRRGGTCMDGDVVALVPPTRSEETSDTNEYGAVDATVSSHPTFFVRVPELDGPTQAQFTLQDELGEHQLYSVQFELNGKGGIVGITVPEDAAAMEVGQHYFWQMQVICNAENAAENPTLSSWVERVSLDTPEESGLSAAMFYAEQGIWQDAVAILAQLHYSNPSDAAVAADWQELLDVAGLTEFSTEPIVQMYKEAS